MPTNVMLKCHVAVTCGNGEYSCRAKKFLKHKERVIFTLLQKTRFVGDFVLFSADNG